MYEADKTGYHWRERLGVSDEGKNPQLFFYALLYYPNFYEPVSFNMQVTSYGKTQVNFLASPIYIFKCGEFNFLNYICICHLSVFNSVLFIIRKWYSKMLQSVTPNEIDFLKYSFIQIYFTYHKMSPVFQHIHCIVQSAWQSNFRTFSPPPKEISYSLAVTPCPLLHTHNSGQPLIYSLSIYLPILDIAQKWNHRIHVFCGWLLSLSVLSRSIHIVLRSECHSFYGCITFHRLAIYLIFFLLTHFIYQFISWQTFQLFSLLDCYNNAAINIHLRVFRWDCQVVW